MLASWKQRRQHQHIRQGRRAEKTALRYLFFRGLILIERNFTCRGGEIDLIMQTRRRLNRQRRQLVFVEVRYRSMGLDAALLSINPQKVHRLTLAAHVYLAKNFYRQKQPCRFDVVTVTEKHGRHHCQWLQNAWQLDN